MGELRKEEKGRRGTYLLVGYDVEWGGGQWLVAQLSNSVTYLYTADVFEHLGLYTISS